MDKNSIFFNFHENVISKSQPKIMKYIGWSGLVVLKFNMKANEQIKSLVLDTMFPELKKKEKIFFIIKGNISLVSEMYKLYLKEYDAFNYLKTKDHFVLFGIKPTYAETGFGYIKAKKDDKSPIKKIEAFFEKPTLEKAEAYIKEGYLWNSGMFLSNTASVSLPASSEKITTRFENDTGATYSLSFSPMKYTS
jgi:hypothetical protein